MRLNLLGEHSGAKPEAPHGMLPRGTSLLHFVVWKFIVMALTFASLRGEKVDAASILAKARVRMTKKLKSVEQLLAIELVKEKVRLGRFRSWLEGLADVTDEGAIELKDNFAEWLKGDG